MFRHPTLWEEHRALIIGIVTVLVVQASLIAALLAQRAWRQRSEREAVELRHELTHAGRVTMLGQLASSLAHELNQPLGAILRNAEAAELFLKPISRTSTRYAPLSPISARTTNVRAKSSIGCARCSSGDSSIRAL